MRKIAFLLVLTMIFVGCDFWSSSQKAQSGKKAKTIKTDQLIALGIKHLDEGKAIEAIRSFDAAIQADPMNPKGYMILGQTYLRLGNIDRAIDTFLGLVRVSPRDGNAHYLLAIAYHMRGNDKEAIDYAKKSVILFQKDENKKGLQQALIFLKSMLDSQQTAAKK